MTSAGFLIHLKRMCLVAGWIVLLSGCSSKPDLDAIPQQWQGLDVRLESRPSPPAAGMNEFLVIVTDQHGQPAWNCMINIRTADADPWKQAIQDGREGVYRRAALLGEGERSILQVKIKRGDTESTLRFPLNLAAP